MKATHKKFEYKTIIINQGGKPHDWQLDEMGADGWELVAVIGSSDLQGWGRHQFEYIFKREKLK